MKIGLRRVLVDTILKAVHLLLNQHFWKGKSVEFQFAEGGRICICLMRMAIFGCSTGLELALVSVTSYFHIALAVQLRKKSTGRISRQ